MFYQKTETKHSYNLEIMNGHDLICDLGLYEVRLTMKQTGRKNPEANNTAIILPLFFTTPLLFLEGHY